MWILPDPQCDVSAERIRAALEMEAAGSRFRLRSEIGKLGSRHGLSVYEVRLRRKKPYCGAHPGPCLVNPLFERKHRVYSYLEGLDWLGFFQMLNNLLDRLGASCEVFTYNREASSNGRYYLRRGRLRRVAYPYAYDRGNHWTQDRDDLTDDDVFQDHVGKPPPPYDEALLSDGTPGYACYTPADEEELRGQEEAHV